MNESILQFFKYLHLPAHLQEVSAPFAVMAEWICAQCPPSIERDMALRKLLEAKDCAVRASLFKGEA